MLCLILDPKYRSRHWRSEIKSALARCSSSGITRLRVNPDEVPAEVMETLFLHISGKVAKTVDWLNACLIPHSYVAAAIMRNYKLKHIVRRTGQLVERAAQKFIPEHIHLEHTYRVFTLSGVQRSPGTHLIFPTNNSILRAFAAGKRPLYLRDILDFMPDVPADYRRSVLHYTCAALGKSVSRAVNPINFLLVLDAVVRKSYCAAIPVSEQERDAVSQLVYELNRIIADNPASLPFVRVEDAERTARILAERIPRSA